MRQSGYFSIPTPKPLWEFELQSSAQSPCCQAYAMLPCNYSSPCPLSLDEARGPKFKLLTVISC